ncbi:transcription factor PAR1 [Prunus avium]|uniref:Transcription factor PAR1 n=1 Tax=Prunus avium TaxID=42229 RepID=A0A6P5S7E2_PRUAV|nr:transcription factor PAR1 [Prunus avium]
MNNSTSNYNGLKAHSSYRMKMKMTRRRRQRQRQRQVGGRGGRRSTVQVKVKKLQMLIPGGRGLKADRLFLQTADYILQLRLQVNVLQALSKIYKL